MRGYLQFSFWIPIALAKICFSNSHKARKDTSVLVGSTWNSHLAFQEIFKVKFSRGFHGILYHEIEKLVNIIIWWENEIGLK